MHRALASPFYAQVVPAGEEEAPKGSPEFWWKLAISAVLVLAGGVFAGCVVIELVVCSALMAPLSLTLGLMGLDELHLRVLAASSDDIKEKRNAQKGAWSPR